MVSDSGHQVTSLMLEQSNMQETKTGDMKDVVVVDDVERLPEDDDRASRSWAYRTWTNSWFQIFQIAIAAFCMPGMYNAMSGTGGGGNVDRESTPQTIISLYNPALC